MTEETCLQMQISVTNYTVRPGLTKVGLDKLYFVFIATVATGHKLISHNFISIEKKMIIGMLPKLF